MNINCEFPPIFAINEQCNRNPIQQFILPIHIDSVDIEPYTSDPTKGYVITPSNKYSDQIFITTKISKPPDEFIKVI